MDESPGGFLIVAALAVLLGTIIIQEAEH